MNRVQFLVPLGMALCIPGTLTAQLRGSLMSEAQVGNLPFIAPENLLTSMNDLRLFYNFDKLQFDLRGEIFLHQDKSVRFQEITQRSVTYSDDEVEIRVGNSLQTLGRGLLLRSYEVPGGVFEDRVFRRRYPFYRDVDGIVAGYQSDPFSVKGLIGSPLLNSLPPDAAYEDRHPELLAAVQTEVTPVPWGSIGGIYLRRNPMKETREYASGFVSARGGGAFRAYMEYAQQLGGGNSPFSLQDHHVHAFYGSLSVTTEVLSGSVEYKNYKNFLLGFGFNDPPPAVREHTYRTLNRSTHVADLTNEEGWQVEMLIPFVGGHSLTFNGSYALNHTVKRNEFIELFAEAAIETGPSTQAKLFIDWSQDDITLERSRWASGATVEFIPCNEISASVSGEYQQFRRMVDPVQDVRNFVLSAYVTVLSNYSLGMVVETSTDPVFTDDPRTLVAETSTRSWLGIVASANLGMHRAELFAGKRRGGPACTSGICYEVLDFEGVELRLLITL